MCSGMKSCRVKSPTIGDLCMKEELSSVIEYSARLFTVQVKLGFDSLSSKIGI